MSVQEDNLEFVPGAEIEGTDVIPAGALKSGSVVTDDLADQAVTLAKFSRGDTAGKFLIAQGSSSDAQWGTMGGDASLDGSGALTLAEGLPRQATQQLTAAQVKALATTPIELVAAPGADKVILFMGAELVLIYGSEVFAESGDNLQIKYTDAAGAAVSQAIETTGFIDQSADTLTNALPSADAIVARSACANQPLVLDNIGSNITGNASNDSIVRVNVLYRVVSL